MSAELLQHIRQTIAHNVWANEQVAASLVPIPRPPAKAVLVLAHIVGAERVWHARLTRTGAFEVWPSLNVMQCVEAMRDLRRQWMTWIDSLGSTDLDQPVSYVNSRGESWTNTVREIIAHVTHHSSYHRGQIATLIGSEGYTPPGTDFILAVREGRLDQTS